MARVTTSRAEAVAVAKVSDRQRRGSLFAPMHWTDAFAPSGRANALVAPHVDPTSGQPEFKHTPAWVRAYRETWKGFFLSRSVLNLRSGRTSSGGASPRTPASSYEFAGRGDAVERDALRKALTRGCGRRTRHLRGPRDRRPPSSLGSKAGGWSRCST
ncbi:molybdopterin dinucleotide binding domain-containing protein [Caulobacter segnis]